MQTGVNSAHINFTILKDILIALNESEQEFTHDIKLHMAIHYYQTGKLSMGKAVELSGLSRYQFESILSQRGISISNLTEDDIKKDIDTMRDLCEE